MVLMTAKHADIKIMLSTNLYSYNDDIWSFVWIKILDFGLKNLSEENNTTL